MRKNVVNQVTPLPKKVVAGVIKVRSSAVVNSKKEMRYYRRYPSGIPLEIFTKTLPGTPSQTLKDVSVGGLSFFSDYAHSVHDTIKVSIPYVKPAFVSEGQVTWCLKQGDRYEVGVEFLTADDESRTCLVKQAFYIENFIKEVKNPDRPVDDIVVAAREWISRNIVDSSDNEPEFFTSRNSLKNRLSQT